MPWSIVDGEETWSRPEPDQWVLPPGVVPGSQEAQANYRERKDALLLYKRRMVVDWMELHTICPRKACRRTQSCRSPTVACHDEHKPMLEEEFYAEVRPLLRARLGER